MIEKNDSKIIVPPENIEQKIFMLRGHRVMLDKDLAELYGVTIKRLNEQVKRNRERFPGDFMFQINTTEAKLISALRSQIATLNQGGHRKYLPYAFTEHGAVMLANVLKSRIAVRASIQVIRAFIHLRQLIATNEKLLLKVEILEKKVGEHDADLKVILAAIRRMLKEPEGPEKPPMGFRLPKPDET